MIQPGNCRLLHSSLKCHQCVTSISAAGGGRVWKCFISIGLLVKVGYGSAETARQVVLQSWLQHHIGLCSVLKAGQGQTQQLSYSVTHDNYCSSDTIHYSSCRKVSNRGVFSDLTVQLRHRATVSPQLADISARHAVKVARACLLETKLPWSFSPFIYT